MLTIDSNPRSGTVGRVVGVAYMMLIVHVPPAATVVPEQVFAVTLYKPPMLSGRDAAPIANDTVPLLVTVTTLVTAARGAGIVKVRTRAPNNVASVPFVAEVKLNVPPIPVPVRVTGEPVTVAPV